MSDYADGAEAMRKAILARFAELESEWRKLRDTYDPRGQYEDREVARQEIEGYKTATGIVRGIALEDRTNQDEAMKCDECGGMGTYWLMPNGERVECSMCEGSGEIEGVRNAPRVSQTQEPTSGARTTALDYSDPDDAAYGAGFEAMREKAAELWATFGGEHKFIELLNEVQP